MTPNFDKLPFFELSSYILWIAGAFFLLIIQFGFYFRLVFLTKSKEEQPERPVSVLLNVRNEQDRIRKILLQLLEQHYVDYEVIVVDDFSEDATSTILGVLAEKYPRLRLSSLSQETRFSEKLAINLALKAAHADWVIFVTPETEEVSPLFLKKINNETTDEPSLTLNYINYLPQKGFYNKLCRVERFYSFMTSSAYSLSGIPVFFQQSNVLFRKQIYFDSAGFKGRMNAHFANLELLFNQVRKNKVFVSVDQETCLHEKADLTRSDFSELVRKRILLKKKLRWWKRVLLGMESSSAFFMFCGLAGLLITSIRNWFIYIIPLFLILAVHVFIVKTLLNHLNEKKIFLSSLMYLFVKPVVNFYHRSLIYIHAQRSKWI